MWGRCRTTTISQASALCPRKTSLSAWCLATFTICPSATASGIWVMLLVSWTRSSPDGVWMELPLSRRAFRSKLPGPARLRLSNRQPWYRQHSARRGSRVREGCRRSGTAGKVAEWFNTDCFSPPPLYGYGTEARVDSSLRAAGINNWDIALFKTTTFGPENKLGIQFRTEFFNTFNRVQFGFPGTGYNGINAVHRETQPDKRVRNGHFAGEQPAVDSVRTEVPVLARERNEGGCLPPASTFGSSNLRSFVHT